METLPIELVEKILTEPLLSVRDVINMMSTSHYFLKMVSEDNLIWKYKFMSMWRKFSPEYTPLDANFYQEIMYIYKLRKKAKAILDTMSPRFYKRYELSDLDLAEWLELLNEKKYNYFHLVKYLMELVDLSTPPIKGFDTVPFTTPGHKTLKYYAYKALRFIRQQYLSNVWYDYISLPSKQQILEIGAVFVAQWCQPALDIDLDTISKELDKIAAQVGTVLHAVYPKHSLFSVPKSELLRWKRENLTQNQYNATESRLLLTVIRQVLFQDLGFKGNNNEYYMPYNSLINEVLEKRQGVPITLAIVFEAVARRLGLRCDPINAPVHFLLRFCEQYEPNSDWYYLDVFHGGQVVLKGACPHNRFAAQKKFSPVATAAQVVERMANNLEVSARQHNSPSGRITRLRSSLELLKLVNPHDISALVSLARLYMLQNMDTRTLEQFLLTHNFQVPEQAQRVVHMLRDYEAHHAHNESTVPVGVAKRSADLKFAVGMVMTHLNFDYKCVIYDWDPVCLAAEEWQASNNVNQLRNKADQPFYNVLAEDGSHRYVAQENLIPTRDMGYLYLNDEVGRHFSHFYKTHYVPNIEKAAEYPADKDVRLCFHYQMTMGC